MTADIRYAKRDGTHLAYRVDGDGPITLLYLRMATSSIDSFDDEPRVEAFFRRLAGFVRLVRMDIRGVGLSDPLSGEVTYPDLALDVLAVADDLGVDRFALAGELSGGPLAIEVAASVPERVSALVLLSTYARASRDDEHGYPFGHPPELIAAFLDQNFDPQEHWEVIDEEDDTPRDDVSLIAPSLADDAHFRGWWGRSGRRGASPAVAHAIQTASVTADQRALLPAVTAPTLVVHRRDNVFIPVDLGRYLGDTIPGARFVELDGADAAPWSGAIDEICDEIEEFLTDRRSGRADRVLATLLFTDIVGSTDRLAQAGDRRWNTLLEVHDRVVREQLVRFGGREVSTAGDSFFAVFPTPSHALACARAVAEATREVGIDVRAGVHTGECDVRGDDFGGLAVVIAARVSALAGAGEVLVTATVRDLVVGSDATFTERGTHVLKGVPGDWPLLALDRPS